MFFPRKITLLLESIYINREEDKEALKEEAGINIKSILENIDVENKKQASLQDTNEEYQFSRMTKPFFQTVKNLEKFGPVTNDTVVIIIQVISNCFYPAPVPGAQKRGQFLFLLLNIVVVVLSSSDAEETWLSFLMLSHVSYLVAGAQQRGQFMLLLLIIVVVVKYFCFAVIAVVILLSSYLAQVHNREGYLRQLVNSLSAARHIENTLLVFSHDVWDEQINTLVRYESS